MATISAWIEGARLRTLPASAAPVLLGTGIAFGLGRGNAWLAVGCLVVALAIQIGVNFANDYSDGIRGTDEHRLGPPRLVGGGENPRRVLAAALGFFALAAGVGLAVVIASASWWLVAAGAAALVAAWFYTGGKHPYGYTGWGVSELMVFVFFGLLATLGTLWVQAKTLPWQAWLLAAALGLLSCALLMVNNLRDIPTDTQSGKRTLAVRLGDRGARWAYVGLVVAALVLAAVVVFIPWPAVFSSGVRQWLPGFAVLLVIWGGAAATMRPVRRGATGRDLVVALRNTGFLTLAFGALLALLFALG
ncbi:1,4-dihydroxy-2-naphthoate polyprenyltransferase [Mobiluncus mulieris]|uniref:1,4-dihydroxy-2-naphthoate polyprenyltransferase n=1 Tax=Mobiluncus mulieris TaxID=2052 RepID=UPI00243092CF|nr:1,4-dihydroxy-2-naphthoate polyprenyltransferase [Mobiluncus mulieris]